MSLSPITALDKDSTDNPTRSRIEIPVSGFYCPGSTKDGKVTGPPFRLVTGKVVFEGDELHSDTEFTAEGKSTGQGTRFEPAARSNTFVSFVSHKEECSISSAVGDESKYSLKPRFYFKPSHVQSLNEEQASLLARLKGTGTGKVQGRDDEGHLIPETIVGRQEAE